MATFFELIGILTVASFVLSFIHNIAKAYYPLTGLSSRYGPGSWVVVTGASDGIGKAFATVLARLGFSICLVARSQEKLEKVKAEIQKQYPNVQYKVVVADFKNSAQPGFFEKIDNELTGLDISILVNNVGVAPLDYFEKTPEQDLSDAVIINLLPQVMLTRKLINRLAARKGHKSAVLNVGSNLGIRPTPYSCLYGATKAFTDYFTRAMEGEFRGRVDFLTVRASLVSTPATQEREVNAFIIKPEEAAEGSLRALGKTSWTYGHISHTLQGFILNSIIVPMPDFLFGALVNIAGPKLVDANRKLIEEYSKKTK